MKKETKPTRPAFGARLIVNNKLTRVNTHANDKKWVAAACEKKCIFLGVRTLSNGKRFYDNEYGYQYEPRQHFTAALVCAGDGANPFYTLLNMGEFKGRFDTSELTKSGGGQ